jgi:metal-sulfur cluster biosynthetic enzyme
MNESEIGTPEVREESSTVALTEAATPPVSPAEGAPVGKEAVLEALRNVFDPELGINIVDLGLVYEVEIGSDGSVDITYSLTTMGCPIGPMIEDQMRQFLAPVPGVGEVRPEMVLRPPWSPEMMSDEAKAALGIF